MHKRRGLIVSWSSLAVTSNLQGLVLLFFQGLDISKHGEPAYPIGAYAESTSYQIPKPVMVNERTNPAFSNMDASMSSQQSGSRLPYAQSSGSAMS
jgi:hypothetical protein